VLAAVTGAQVRNCHVTTFRRGLRVIGGGSHTLVGNELSKNKYGIDLAGQTAANRIEGNVIRDSRDEGIHAGTGASDNLIVGNQIVNSKAENVYILEASGTRVIGNVIVNAGNASVFIKHSTDSYVASNLVWDTGIELRGDSWGNILEHNQLRGGDGFLFEAYQEDVWKYPHDNQVRGGTVFNAKPCVRMFGAYDNHVQGVTIDDDCGAIQEAPAGGLPPSGNTFDLTVTEPGPAGARSAVQVTTSARELRAGDVLTLGLAVHNGPTNVPLDLYVGILLPDHQIGFFASQGGFSTAPAAMVPLQPAAPSSFSLALSRFVEVALPVGTPVGIYQFFAACLIPDALADGVVTAEELAAFALESFTVEP
jgi:parallel beta-helix repeat protein